MQQEMNRVETGRRIRKAAGGTVQTQPPQEARQNQSVMQTQAAVAMSEQHVKEIDECDFLAFPAVTHQPAHCPNCGSSINRTYKTVHPTQDTTKRYHECNKCRAKFRSLEELNRVDYAIA